MSPHGLEQKNLTIQQTNTRLFFISIVIIVISSFFSTGSEWLVYDIALTSTLTLLSIISCLWLYREKLGFVFKLDIKLAPIAIPVLITCVMGWYQSKALSNFFGSSDDNLRIAFSLYAILLSVAWEELVFRGFLTKAIKSRMLKPLLSSFLFSAFHISSTEYFGLDFNDAIFSYIFLFSFSLVLYYSFLLTKNIITPILIHFSYNAWSFNIIADLRTLSEIKFTNSLDLHWFLFLISGVILLYIVLFFSRNSLKGSKKT